MNDLTITETKTSLHSNGDVGMYYCGKRIKTLNHKYGPEIRNHYLLVLVNEGEADFIHRDRIIPLKAHDLLVMCPGERIYYEAKTPWSIQWLGLYGEGVDKFLKQLSINGDTPIMHVKYFHEVSAIMDKICSNAKCHTLTSSAMQLGLIYEFFSVLLKNGNLESKPDVVECAIKIMYYNVNTEITIGEIADALHVNASHFTRIFSSAVGVSPKQYMLNQKLNYAKTLLTETNAPISDISQSVGYEDQLYFSRIFKKKQGVSPSDYRKSHQN